MGVNFDLIENVIELDETVSVEEAETLLQLLLEHEEATIDASNCTHMHTAAVQVLLASKPKFTKLPKDEFLKRFLAPNWDFQEA